MLRQIFESSACRVGPAFKRERLTLIPLLPVYVNRPLLTENLLKIFY